VRLRIFIAVTHLLGAGHLTRAAALARAFARAGHAVTLASGGMPAPLVRTAGLRLVQLPPVKVEGTDFKTLVDERGRRVGPEHLAERRAALLAAFEAAAPDVLITELFPFGRRVLADEFAALLEAARRRGPSPVIAASIRDILVAPDDRGRLEEAHGRLQADYDAVLVHGDPALAPLELSWPLDQRARRLVHFTGYLDEAFDVGDRPSPRTRSEIIVSGGSSSASLPLYRAALEAAPSVADRSWRILVGQGVDQEEFERLRAAAPPHATIERARPDFRALLAGAALSVSQAGYNTVVDLLRAGVRAILVPFEAGRETEQRLRAERLASRGLASIVPQARLSGETLAEAIRANLAGPPPRAPTIDLDGAETSVAIIERIVAARPPRPAVSSPARVDWSPLDRALGGAAERGRSFRFWWRDDDAVAHTPALDRLLSLASRTELPIALAVIPARLEPSLAARLGDEGRLCALVHGLCHVNQAGPGAKKAEFGAERAFHALAADAECALETAAAALGARLLPVFVPPWNRIAPTIAAALPRLGYRGLSTFGNRGSEKEIAGLVQVNAHIDPVDWRRGRGLLKREKLLALLASMIADRVEGRSDPDEPIGLLTHHLIHDEPVWTFCAELLYRLSLHANVRYPSARELFLVANASNREVVQGLS
jgi:predicted glycosyltransferase